MQIYTSSCPDPGRESGEDTLYLDIETTGLDRKRTILYLIGCCYVRESTRYHIQWFNNDAVSEEAMLYELRDLLGQRAWKIVTFNGDSFDLPYLRDHFLMNECDCDLSSYPSVDYFRILRPFSPLFGLEHSRQKDWEQFLGIHREDRYSGRQLIRVYKEYLQTHSEDALRLLLLHNLEDVRGLQTLKPLMAYPALWKGDFHLEEVCLDKLNGEEAAVFRCRLLSPVPVPVAVKTKESSLIAEGRSFTLTLPLIRDDMKYYYSNYKDYFYLPLEDRAIHKSVGAYVDRAHRVKAKPSTCYIRKEGAYLPAPLPRRKYGFPISDLPDLSTSHHVFRKEYTDRRWYIAWEDFSAEDGQWIKDYLIGMINEISVECLKE